MGAYMVNNYTDATTDPYVYTELNYRNQAWSYFWVEEAIMVDRIDVRWGGYGGTTRGRHCIWSWNGGGLINGLVVASSLMDVADGRGWRQASVTPTILERGSYAVGIWRDPTKHSIFAQYKGKDAGTLYMETATDGIKGSADPDASDGTGVLPTALYYDYPNRVKVKNGSSWVDGSVKVKNGSSWVNAKGIWVKDGSTWKRAK